MKLNQNRNLDHLIRRGAALLLSAALSFCAVDPSAAAALAGIEKRTKASGQVTATMSDALGAAGSLRATDSDAGTAAVEVLYDEDGYLLDGEVLPDEDDLKASASDAVLEEFLEDEALLINPAYEDLLSEDEAKTLLEEAEAEAESRAEGSRGSLRKSRGRLRAAAADIKERVCTSREEAAETAREFLKERNTSFDVNFSYYDIDGLRQEMIEILLLAMEHTGDPKEGDYLLFQYLTAGGKSSATKTETDEGTLYTGTFHITMAYFTSAEQEAEVDARVAEVLEELDLEGCSTVEKIRRIYSFICGHVRYDRTHPADYYLKYSAYAALINGEAVCQGYATLFYRMALETGIGCRMLSGTGNGDPHGWNIVEIGGLWYDLDPTWDAGEEEYRYFLKCEENFDGHVRDEQYETDEFHTAYPMAEKDYITVFEVTVECGSGGSLLYTLRDPGEEDTGSVNESSGGSTPAGGTIAPGTVGIISAPYDYDIIFTWTPDPGYALAAIGADGEVIHPSEDGRYVLKKVRADRNLTFVFDYGKTNEGLVRRFYRKILGREADRGGLAYWMAGLKNGTIDAGELFSFMLFSQEYSSRMNALPGAEELLEEFGVTDSGEGFRSLCEDCGAPAGNAAGQLRFLRRLYVMLLGRKPDTGGLLYWGNRLRSGEISMEETAVRILFSEEASRFSKGNGEYVRFLYRAFLGREPDSGGYQYWISALKSGMTRLNLAERILDSPEFKRMVHEYYEK